MTNLDHYLEIGRSKHRENGYQLWSPEGYKVILPPRFYEEVGPQNDDVMDNDAARIRILGGYNILGRGMFMGAITITRRHLQGSVSSLGNQPSELVQAHMFVQFPRTDGELFIQRIKFLPLTTKQNGPSLRFSRSYLQRLRQPISQFCSERN